MVTLEQISSIAICDRPKFDKFNFHVSWYIEGARGMGLFLTNEELQELTGYRLPSKQVIWLKCHGYFVETNVRGIPRITQLQIEDMRRNQMQENNVIKLNHSQNLSNDTEPNFNNLRTKIKKNNHG